MQTIQLKSEVTLSLGDVLKGMEKLSVEEMDAFMKKLLTIRAKKIALFLRKGQPTMTDL